MLFLSTFRNRLVVTKLTMWLTCKHLFVFLADTKIVFEQSRRFRCKDLFWRISLSCSGPGQTQIESSSSSSSSGKNTNLAPSRRQTASMTVCTNSGGFVKTRISEISLLSSASRAYSNHRVQMSWDKCAYQRLWNARERDIIINWTALGIAHTSLPSA